MSLEIATVSSEGTSTVFGSNVKCNNISFHSMQQFTLGEIGVIFPFLYVIKLTLKNLP
jgi:hypothetical protein